MYFLFRMHHWEPQRYLEMGYGARKVVKSFLRREFEEIEKENKAREGW
ncbi:hypothetical protein lbkm_3837 [Lachnospiraceae bacterium KM106-2]|nr:hypothetical protein lbkm_3837 [Lachnospiraceae bacterium KM106-2]